MKRIVLAVLTLLPVAACGDGAGGKPAHVPGPTTVQPDEPNASVARGFERVTCELRTENRSVVMKLDVPSKIVPERTFRRRAGQQLQVRRRQADPLVQVWLVAWGADASRAELKTLFEQITGSVRRT